MKAVLAVALIGCAMRPSAPVAMPALPVPTIELDLRAENGLTCHAYIARGDAPITSVILWMAGTGTESNAFLPDDLQLPHVAVVTFDKPGVRAPFGHPEQVTISDTAFQRYTQGSLVACAREAVADVRTRFGDVPLILRGHSEGSLIALAVYDSTPHVRALVLSGLPLEPFAELAQRQLASQPELARAFAACDWSVMKEVGVSCAYLADAATRPSGRAMFEAMAARRAQVEIEVFAGADDPLTPAHFIHELDDWNRATGHLELHVHAFGGSHRGSPEARRELHALLERLTR